MDKITRRELQQAARSGSGQDVFNACQHLWRRADLDEAAEVIEREAGPSTVRLRDAVLIDGTEVGRWGVFRNRGGAT